MLSQPDIPVTSTLMQSVQNSTAVEIKVKNSCVTNAVTTRTLQQLRLKLKRVASQMLSQPDITVTSTLMQPVQNSTTVNSSFPTICELQNSTTVSSSFPIICELQNSKANSSFPTICELQNSTTVNSFFPTICELQNSTTVCSSFPIICELQNSKANSSFPTICELQNSTTVNSSFPIICELQNSKANSSFPTICELQNSTTVNSSFPTTCELQNSTTVNSSFPTICELQNSTTVNSSFPTICELQNSTTVNSSFPTICELQNSTTVNSSFATICELQNSTVNSSFPTICELPSPKEPNKSCANCATKEHTYMNMLQKNKRLHLKLTAIKMLLGVENGLFSLKRFSNKLKRKTQLVTKWKDKYTSLMEDFKDSHNLSVCMESLDLQAKTLERKLTTYQEENINLASVNQQLESIFETAEKDHADLKQENARLKRSLEKAEIANTHFKHVHKRLRSVFEKTENDIADLKWHIQASHSPDMEIKEEYPWQDGGHLGDNIEIKNEEIKQEDIDTEHSKSQWWEVTSDSDETAKTFQDNTSDASMNDMFCGERCQMIADDDCLDHGPTIYIDNAEVLCEYISNEDVNTAEEKVL
ncbi:hypothetical protein BsWGS_13658 [Bradybaena similaris]